MNRAATPSLVERRAAQSRCMTGPLPTLRRRCARLDRTAWRAPVGHGLEQSRNGARSRRERGWDDEDRRSEHRDRKMRERAVTVVRIRTAAFVAVARVARRCAAGERVSGSVGVGMPVGVRVFVRACVELLSQSVQRECEVALAMNVISPVTDGVHERGQQHPEREDEEPRHSGSTPRDVGEPRVRRRRRADGPGKRAGHHVGARRRCIRERRPARIIRR
jgi:hypothetical protein